MKTSDIFALAVNLGKASDPRGLSGVERYLSRIKQQYEKLNPTDKDFFNQEKLTNPYLDSGIHYDSGKEVKKILVGIDIDSADIIMAKNLGYDLVVSHHPEGKGLTNLDEVMHLQADLLNATANVPINIAEGILRKRTALIKRNLAGFNHYKVVDTAKLLDISFISTHTPSDNLVWYYLQEAINQKKPEYISELMEILDQIPEYQEGKKRGAGPTMFAGNLDNRTGKIACTEITGGTSNDKAIYEKIAASGIGTIIGMHMGEDSREEAEKNHLNVIIAGHISSDSLGMNIFLDELEARGPEVTACSGFIRIKRK